jgi:hypothetical protein
MTSPVTTTTPTLGAPVPGASERVDKVASTFATMAAEAQEAALNLRADQARVILAALQQQPQR